MNKKIYLVRHGETVWNREKRMQGAKDSSLTETGIEDSKRVSKRFYEAGVMFDEVYSSPQLRALQTCKIICQNQNEPIKTDKRLKEIDLFLWEGRKMSDIEKNDPINHNNFWNNPHLYNPEKGETFFNVKERVLPFFNDICSKDTSKTVLIVSHTTVIRTILHSVDEIPIEKFWEPPLVFPSSISIINVSEKGFLEIQKIGDNLHSLVENKSGFRY